MKKLIYLFAFAFTLSVLAQEVPTIKKPKELKEGNFKEGVITKISAEKIQDFYRWARSAKRVLDNALEDISRLPMSEKVSHLKKEIQKVVTKSGKKNYQTLMRYALNRGLLFSDLIEQEADMTIQGSKENQLDLLRGAIKVALSFYESDLSFQKKIESGQSSVEIPQAKLGITLVKNLYQRGLNIQDLSAQYRVQYKLLEILAWDLSQDRYSRDYSESIVEIYESLSSLQETPGKDGVRLLNDVRKLNFIYSRSLRYLKEERK